MNFLTHLFFSNEKADNIKGLIIGKAFRDRYSEQYNLETLKGIALDMQINLLAENHPAFLRSIERINFKYGHYASFLINIFYDHLLAKNWSNYSEVSLQEFSSRIYTVMRTRRIEFPNKIKKYSKEMLERNWLNKLKSIEGTHQYLKMISKHERLTVNLDQSLFELMENYRQYHNDFDEFFSSLCEFMQEEEKRFNKITSEKEVFLLSA